MKFLGGDIYQGDCLDVMKDIPDQSVGMILCDLPYGTTQNKWDSVIPFDRLWAEYRRIIKPRGVIAISSQGIFTAKLILSNEAWFKYKFVWVKSKATNFLNARRQPLRQHEDICIFYCQQPDYKPVMWQAEPYYIKGTKKERLTGSYGKFKSIEGKSNGERLPTDTLYCKTAENEKGGRIWHPTQKPVALGRYLIRMFTGPEDVVLDNAFGSGSFLVAAAMEGRRYIGIEKNEEVLRLKKDRIDCIKVAQERIEEVKKMLERGETLPDLLDDLQPSVRMGMLKRSRMIDSDKDTTRG